MISVFLLSAFLSLLSPSSNPFTVEATQDDSANFPDAPRLESASFGQWKGRWLFVGGRIAGYHAVGGAAADFPRADSNREVWVIDSTVRPAKSYHLPVAQLPDTLACLKDEWMSTSQLYYQDGSSLYIAGGYGIDSSGHWVTFPTISKIDLPRFIEGVLNGRFDADSVSYGASPSVQAAGGELIKLPDNHFYLVMGHIFTGSYTAFEGQGEHNSAPVSQAYLNEIRRLKITGSGRTLSVSLLDTFRDEVQFHRRDLNVTPIISPKGIGLAAYGGVFTPDTQLSYSNPVYLFGAAKPFTDASFEQKMNAYNCAKLAVYDQSAGAMYTTFFGGISRFSWDDVTGRYVENPRTSKNNGNYLDGLQWSNQISTVRRIEATGGERTEETVQPVPLPAFIGTDALFIPIPELARASAETDVIDLAPLKGKKTFIGYLYGGIRAYPFRFPYNKTAQPYTAGTVPTKPSDLILKVYLDATKN